MGTSKALQFYQCKHCGNIVQMIYASGVPVVCCGEPMQELKPNTVDAAVEKHVPVAQQDGDLLRVEIGAVAHPMLPEHYIEWIYLETEDGTQRKILSAEDDPSAAFYVGDAKPLAVYAYCNIHGLWKLALDK